MRKDRNGHLGFIFPRKCDDVLLASSPGPTQILSRSRDKIWVGPGDEASAVGLLLEVKGDHNVTYGTQCIDM